MTTMTAPGTKSSATAPKSKVQDVKKLVARIKAAGRAEHMSHAMPDSKGKTK